MSPSATSLIVETLSSFQPGAGLVFPPAPLSPGPSPAPRQRGWLPPGAGPRSSHPFYFMNLPFALLQGKTHSPIFRPAVGKGEFGEREGPDCHSVGFAGFNAGSLQNRRPAEGLCYVWEEKGLCLLLLFAAPYASAWSAEPCVALGRGELSALGRRMLF